MDQSSSCAYWLSVGLCSNSYVRERCPLGCSTCRIERPSQDYWHQASYVCDAGELAAPSAWCTPLPCSLPAVLPAAFAYSYAPSDPRRAPNCDPSVPLGSGQSCSVRCAPGTYRAAGSMTYDPRVCESIWAGVRACMRGCAVACARGVGARARPYVGMCVRSCARACALTCVLLCLHALVYI